MADYEEFVALHEPQLKLSSVPTHFWRVLFRKLARQTLDAGDKFTIGVIDYEGEERKLEDPEFYVCVSAEDGIDKDNPENIFLIDHAWTFRIPEARGQLLLIPGLAERMAKLMSCHYGQPHAEMVEDIYEVMWKYIQPYALGYGPSIEQRMPVWYVMDEFGSCIQHSNDPSFRAVPFLHIPDQIAYTLLFPIKSLEKGDEATRNCIEGSLATSSDHENALLLAWFNTDFSSVSFEQEEPDKQYFIEGRVEDTQPNLSVLEREERKSVCKKEKGIYKVFSEYKYVHEFLSHPQFKMTDDENEADILWYTTHFSNFEDLSLSKPHVFINQFPFEHVLTVKDLLCIVCRRKLSKGVKSFDPESLETHPEWLPTTYNLKTEIVQFASYYQNRAARNMDNHWICKPFNLARGLDIHITNNIKYITRLPFSGPKIAQKYIDNPVLLEHPDGNGKVKFDIRYVILLTNVEPLQAYVYKKFFLRLANKPFDLNDLGMYEKHYTVMNYRETQLCQVLYDDFIVGFESQYLDHKWADVEAEIFSMLLKVLECATFKPPPQGIAHSPQSRALYAADIMLSWQTDSEGGMKMQPKLLEMNWMPDCQRACDYYPQFFNDVFALMFLDKVNYDVFAKL